MKTLSQRKKEVIENLKTARNSSIVLGIIMIPIFFFLGMYLWGLDIFGIDVINTFTKIMAAGMFIFAAFYVISIFSSISSTAEQINEIENMNEAELDKYISDFKKGLVKAGAKLLWKLH